MKTALLLGATGLVGRHLLQRLLDDPHYDTVITLTRRPLSVEHPRLRSIVFDFEHPDPEVIRADDLYCALGTTLRKAGSKAAQYRVDVEYPVAIGRIARANGVKQYLLVSSVGADARSPSFYLRMKGEVEQQLSAMGFETFISARPSLLLGERAEFRLGERIGIALEWLLRPLIPPRYRGIHADQVAAALIALAHAGLRGTHFVESEELQRLG
ncbi:MAG: NAD(P)H-binding protein [Saprospiraceae bacterium]|nr:NAD(P)H-binding protein [Saprospiraceae bacterium]MDW8230757.1 NAD(P)H-binding protein [Saprospiraceae bacterium]